MTSNEVTARRKAQEFRDHNGLGAQPIHDLVQLIELSTGCDVAVLDVPEDDHGLTMRDPERNTAFIGVARTMNPMRQRSTLAHELAHVLFEDHAVDLGKRSRQEIRADAFARHLLIPYQAVKTFLGEGDHHSLHSLSSVVQYFLVSPQMAAIAMRDANLIDQETVNSWKSVTTPHLATQFGWSERYAALQEESNRVRPPQKLIARAISAYSDGLISAQVIATLRGLPEDLVLQELEEAGITPSFPSINDYELHDLPQVDIDLSGLEDASDSE